MSVFALCLWMLNVALDTAGQVAFKAAVRNPSGADEYPRWRDMLRNGLIWTGVACYAVEFVTWLAFLALVPLSLAVLFAATNIVTVMFAGRIMFHEPGGPLRTAGILLIAAGVAIVGLGAA